MSTNSDLELLAELGVEPIKPKAKATDPKTQRVLSGFEEIQSWMDTHGRAPQNSAGSDVFERMYAVRLLALNNQPSYHDLLAAADRHGLLSLEFNEPAADDDYALLAALGLSADSTDSGTDIRNISHVRTRAEIKAAERVASRTPCQDFARFKPLFDQVSAEIKDARRQSVRFERRADVQQGEFFILKGQLLYIDHMGEVFVTSYKEQDRRLRVIYDDGNESDILMRSLQRALYGDENGRRVVTVDSGVLFADLPDIEGQSSGTIYVLKSLSTDSTLAPYIGSLLKIGVTSGTVKKRIANAAKDPTYLMAEVEVLAEFQTQSIDPQKLEAFLHRFFDDARFALTIKDRFDQPIQPREWFLLPLPIIAEAIELLQSGWLHHYRFDLATMSLQRR